VALKSGSQVTQGHRNRTAYVSIRHLWFLINVP